MLSCQLKDAVGFVFERPCVSANVALHLWKAQVVAISVLKG